MGACAGHGAAIGTRPVSNLAEYVAGEPPRPLVRRGRALAHSRPCTRGTLPRKGSRRNSLTAVDEHTRSDAHRTTEFLSPTGSRLRAHRRRAPHIGGAVLASESPVASVSTVLGRVPFRMLVESRSSRARCFSWPRCSVISSFNAVSSTLLVNCFSSPSGPGQGQALLPGRPHQLLRRSLLRRGLRLVLLRHNIQCRHHGTFLADHVSGLGRKHRFWDSPRRE